MRQRPGDGYGAQGGADNRLRDGSRRSGMNVNLRSGLSLVPMKLPFPSVSNTTCALVSTRSGATSQAVPSWDTPAST